MRSFGIPKHSCCASSCCCRTVLSARNTISSTSLYPDQLSVCSSYRPPLLETQSQRGSMVNSLRIQDRRPLCSVFRPLGFAVGLLLRNPGNRVVVGPRGRPDRAAFKIPLGLCDSLESLLGRLPTTVQCNQIGFGNIATVVHYRLRLGAVRRKRGNNTEGWCGTPPWVAPELGSING